MRLFWYGFAAGLLVLLTLIQAVGGEYIWMTVDLIVCAYYVFLAVMERKGKYE